MERELILNTVLVLNNDCTVMLGCHQYKSWVSICSSHGHCTKGRQVETEGGWGCGFWEL